MHKSKGNAGRPGPVGLTQLRVWEEQSGNVVVVRATGEIDSLTAPRLQKAVLEAVKADSQRVVVDLRDIQFIDSSGIAVLVRTAKRLKAGTRPPLDVLASAPVRRLLGLTGLDTLVTVLEKDERITSYDRHSG